MKVALGAVLVVSSAPLYGQVSSPGTRRAGAQSHRVTVVGAKAIAGDSVWQIQYAVNNPSVRYGTISTLNVDAALPKGMGSNALSGNNVDLLVDATTTPAATKSHVAMQVRGPARWQVLMSFNGILSWEGDSGESGNKRSVISPGSNVGGFTVTETGVPMLRLAWTEPYKPVSVMDDETGAIVPGVYPKGLHGGVSDTTVVVGPGIPRTAVTPSLILLQVRLACANHLMAPSSCAALGAATAGKNADTRAALPQLRRMAGAGMPHDQPHPYVAATILQQLRVLGL